MVFHSDIIAVGIRLYYDFDRMPKNFHTKNDVTLDTTCRVLSYYIPMTDRPTMTALSGWNEDGLTIDGIQKHNGEIIGFEKNKKSNLNHRYNKPVKIIIIIIHTITRMHVIYYYIHHS